MDKDQRGFHFWVQEERRGIVERTIEERDGERDVRQSEDLKRVNS